MNYIDMNSDKTSVTMDKYGSETSATSSFMPQPAKNSRKLSGGHAIDSTNGKGLKILSWLILSNKLTDFSGIDPENGYTLLHYIVENYDNIPKKEQVLEKILSNNKVQSLINSKDIYGNTVLHLCLEKGNHDLCAKLIKMGADPKIKNNANKYIVSDDEASLKQSDSVFAQKQLANKMPNLDQGLMTAQSDYSDSGTKNLANIFNKMGSQRQQVEYTADMPSSFGANTEMPHNDRLFQTDDFLKSLGMGRQSAQNSQFAKSGPSESYNMAPVNLQGSTPNEMNLHGGKKQNKVYGTRRMNMYSEFENLLDGGATSDKRGKETKNKSNIGRSTSETSDVINNTGNLDTTTSDDDFDEFLGTFNNRSSSRRNNASNSKSNSLSRSGSRSVSRNFKYDIDIDTGGLSRQVQSKVDEIHERTIKKIMELMDVPYEVAKNYKAVLYRRIKTEHPELGGFERATEMEKLAYKDNLSEIDIEKVTKEINDFKEEKQKERESSGDTRRSDKSNGDKSNGDKSKKRRTKKTETSSISESRLSATSEY